MGKSINYFSAVEEKVHSREWGVSEKKEDEECLLLKLTLENPGGTVEI